MRKMSITVLLITIVLTASAQKNRFGISAGINSANMVAHYGGLSEHTDGRIGIVFGVNCNMPIAEQFSIQPALNFVQKGYKYKETDVNYIYSEEVRINYMELPVNVLFRPKMKGPQFFIGAGPSLAFALSGKEKENDNGVIDEYDLSFGSNENDDDLKAVDFGFNFLTGIELVNGLNFSVNYNLGLTNLIPGSGTDGSVKNNYAGFKIGYTFSGKKK